VESALEAPLVTGDAERNKKRMLSSCVGRSMEVAKVLFSESLLATFKMVK
jgi:hypothetical protein